MGDAPVSASGPMITVILTATTDVPVPLSTPPLSKLDEDVAVAYGLHSSCNDKIYFLLSEIADFVKKGLWMVLPYNKTANDHPYLHISPAGLIFQRGHRYRLIIEITVIIGPLALTGASPMGVVRPSHWCVIETVVGGCHGNHVIHMHVRSVRHRHWEVLIIIASCGAFPYLCYVVTTVTTIAIVRTTMRIRERAG